MTILNDGLMSHSSIGRQVQLGSSGSKFFQMILKFLGIHTTSNSLAADRSAMDVCMTQTVRSGLSGLDRVCKEDLLLRMIIAEAQPL